MVQPIPHCWNWHFPAVISISSEWVTTPETSRPPSNYEYTQLTTAILCDNTTALAHGATNPTLLELALSCIISISSEWVTTPETSRPPSNYEYTQLTTAILCDNTTALAHVISISSEWVTTPETSRPPSNYEYTQLTTAILCDNTTALAHGATNPTLLELALSWSN
ncbi:hypothetical protein J6590_013939 [Homalodisca vitripennis]|nr:hypothetical protein J6590_013939 [Homalodisca vitripennis]